MPYAYTLTATIPASPEEIYEAWLDSIGHSEMTGGEAMMSDEVGAEVSAWDGYIRGRNLELVPGERIVQSWRTDQFGDEHEDSIITVTLEEADDATLLTLQHSNVPDEQRGYEEGGWRENYFEPMIVYFAERRREAGRASPENATKAAAKTATKARPESVRKPARPASAKSRQTTPRAKTSPKKAKSSRKRKAARGVVTARASKRATASKRKPGRKKRSRARS